ncbi:uncharacterized protein LOC135492666 isoform X2 [Lineus longissimus]|uniref:uncharacterized protein LOC135492666 isoform X2 n=1 Tax=Lineus longissimus TaxID=88925 RepID=UPI00315C9FB4
MSAPEGLNESGYYSMNSTEESSLEIEVIPAPKENIAGHFGPQLIQGGDRGSYWGASIRSCQLLVPDPNHQFHPVEPFFFYHVITNVIPNSNMDKLHARIGFLFEEISGTPTYEMDGNTLAEKLEECRERMENRGSSANFKFHEICENEEGVYYFVQFKSDGTGTLADIYVRESQGKCANAETDDDGHIVECVRLLTSDRVVIMRPAYTKDGQSYYIFSDNGDSIKVRGYLKVEDELMGYMFPMYIYNGIYTGKGSHVSSLQSGDSVNPLVIKLPFNEEDNEKVIAAERTVVDIRRCFLALMKMVHLRLSDQLTTTQMIDVSTSSGFCGLS